jgi:hypothetical protein
MADTAPVEVAKDEEDKKRPALYKYFKTVIKMKVSDLHLKAGRPPHVRMKGDLRPLQGGPLTGEQIRDGIFELLSEKQQNIYEEKGAIDFAYDVGPQGDADRFPRQRLPAARQDVRRRPPRLARHQKLQGALPADSLEKSPQASTRAWSCWPGSPAPARAPRSRP